MSITTKAFEKLQRRAERSDAEHDSDELVRAEAKDALARLSS